MTFIRRIFRLTGLLLWMGFSGAVAALGLFGGRKGLRVTVQAEKLWAWGIVHFLGIKLEVEGDPKSFEGGLIVSNHQSYIDIFCEGSIFPLRFAAKAELRSWPILGWYLMLSRSIWVDRTSRQKSAIVAKEIELTLTEKISMMVYPEGTTSDGKADLLPFKSTPFEAAINVRQPFLPIVIDYKVNDPNKSIPWYGDMELLPHLWSILGIKKIYAKIKILPPMMAKENESRKELAERVWKIMNSEYRRLHNED